MKLVKVTSFSDLKTGDGVRCSINGRATEECAIYRDGYGRYYLCQNVADGNDCDDKQGFDYSWEFTSYNGSTLEQALAANDVTGLRKLVKEGT